MDKIVVHDHPRESKETGMINGNNTKNRYIRRIDLAGNKYNRLTVLEFSHYRKEISYWKVLCDCGNEKVVNGVEIKRGGVKSCGCLAKEFIDNKVKNKKVRIKKDRKPSIGRIVNCYTCNKEIFRSPCYIRERNFCSRKCHHKNMVQDCYRVLNCGVCKKEFKVYESYLRVRKREFCSIRCRRIGVSGRMMGENSPGWKGGKSYQSKRIRKGIEWKLWREAVFYRDNYTCQHCGTRSGKGVKVELHPHHIKQYALFPELRFDVNNGITLCKECHMKTDTYMKKPKTLKPNGERPGNTLVLE